MNEKFLDHCLVHDKEAFKIAINDLNEAQQITYIDTLANAQFVIDSIETITEGIIKNQVDKNPVCFHRFKGVEMSKTLVQYVHEKLKKHPSFQHSVYRESYIKSIQLSTQLLKTLEDD